MTYSSSFALRSTFFLLAVMFHTAAHAEAKVGDRFGDWVLECQAVAAEKNICALTQAVKKGNRPVLRLRIQQGSDKKNLELVAWVPLGIHIPAGVTGAVDKEKAIPLTVQTCIRAACIATTKLDDSLLKSTQSGEKLAISFSLKAGSKPEVVEVSLKGLTEGLKASNLK